MSRMPLGQPALHATGCLIVDMIYFLVLASQRCFSDTDNLESVCRIASMLLRKLSELPSKPPFVVCGCVASWFRAVMSKSCVPYSHYMTVYQVILSVGPKKTT